MAREKKKGFLKAIPGRLLRFFLMLLLLFFILTIVQVAVLRYINPPFTMPMASLWLKDRLTDRHYIVPEGEWRSLREISPHIIRAVLAGEDQRFMSHSGFDFIELNHAVRGILEGERARGASTITMQMARSVFLWQGRSIARKVIEAYYTVLSELFLSKVRILEIYLNTVDWGSGIVGVEAAARKYYNKSALNLTEPEAALLAAILPSPHRWSPLKPNDRVRERQKWIMKNMDKMSL